LRAATAANGHALDPRSAGEYSATEADFLELGCAKSVGKP